MGVILTRAQLDAKHAKDEAQHKTWKKKKRKQRNAKRKHRKVRIHLAKLGRRSNRK